jgi:hypothetical protein
MLSAGVIRVAVHHNKDGSTVRYLQLVHNVWGAQGGYAKAHVIHTMGREDQVDAEMLRFIGSRPFGGAYVIDALWHRLGISEARSRAASWRRISPAEERLIFTLVANRVLAPSSKRAAIGVGGAGRGPGRGGPAGG